MAALTYLLWLTTREGLRPETAAALVRRFGTAEAAYFADPGEYELLSLSERLCRSLADKSLERAERILGDCDRLGVTLLTYQDAAYPERLLQLHDFPLVLYVKGRLFRFDEELAVAIVGSRECTPYGVAMAGRLGLELARSGALVLSGLAQGTGYITDLGMTGPAVSVLAGGVDVVYPRRNQGLYEDVAAAGAILSENPPGTPPEGWRFPIRNRILSGLSAGVAAVEAAEHSGTLITARLALEQNREPEVSGKEALSTMRAIFGSIKSSEIGRTVSVNSSFVNHL